MAWANRIKVEVDASFFTRRGTGDLDLIALPIAPLLQQLEASGRPVFYRAMGPEIIPNVEITNNLSAIEEITIIGYPSNLYDRHNWLPIARRGITATPIWNNFEGKSQFLIDAGVFPGSSGSPVFVFNQGSYATNGGLVVGSRLYLVGVVSQTISRVEASQSTFLGLGLAINAAALLQYVESVVKEIQPPPPRSL